MIYSIVLDQEKSTLWANTAKDCGLMCSRMDLPANHKPTVVVFGTEEDIKTAWMLFVDRHNELCAKNDQLIQQNTYQVNGEFGHFINIDDIKLDSLSNSLPDFSTFNSSNNIPHKSYGPNHV